jgi:hypothetical protein
MRHGVVQQEQLELLVGQNRSARDTTACSFLLLFDNKLVEKTCGAGLDV